MMRLLFAALLCTAIALPALAGQVLTGALQLTGKVTITSSGLRVGQDRVAWDEVVVAELDPSTSTYAPPAAVVTRTGERWAAEVVGLNGGTLTIRSAVLGGQRQIPTADLSAIELGRSAHDQPISDGGVLVLQDAAEPLPSELLWIDRQQLAVESLLGVMKLPRGRVVRYVFEPPSAGEAAADTVELIDGTRLAGAAAPSSDGLTLKHPALGEIRLPEAVIRRIIRGRAGLVHVAQLQPTDVQARPMLRYAPGPTFDADGMTLRAGNTVTYRLPAPGGTFRAIVRPTPGAAGPVRLRVLAGGSPVLERAVGHDAAPALVEADLQGATDLTLEATYMEPVRLPAAVTLQYPHALTR